MGFAFDLEKLMSFWRSGPTGAAKGRLPEKPPLQSDFCMPGV